MTGYQPEHADETRAAIGSVHRAYGAAGLDRESLVREALPASVPADRPPGSLVMAAARAGIAGRLTAAAGAGTAPADAVRTAGAALAATTALAVPACEWIVSEYAALLGYPSVAGPGVPAAPRYRAGTAAPYVPPAYTQPADGTGQYAAVAYPGAPGVQASAVKPRKPNRMPLVIAGVLVAFAVIGFAVIKLTSGDSSCSGEQCQQTLPLKPSGKHSVAPIHTTPPAGGGGLTAVALRYLMPRDITVSACSTTANYPTYLTGLTSYYTCDESFSSALDGALVNGYQFGSPAAYAAGVVAFNVRTRFDPTTAARGCPPAGDNHGYSNWYRDSPDRTLGNVECYRTSSSNPVYVWTDDAEFTIVIAVADGQTFTDLDAWWKANNQNGLSSP